MAALDFPASPSSGQRYSANSSTWEWNGSAWIKLATSSGPTDQVSSTNDTSTTALYPVMVDGAGDNKPLKVSTSKLNFNANNGTLTATTFSGNFSGDGDFVDIDVDGHTNLDNVSIAGVTTIADDKKLYLGNDQDLELYYQTGGVPGAYVQTGSASGNLTIKNRDVGQYVYIHGDHVHLRSTSSNEAFLQAQHN